jgi:NADP-dependent alcohol dehydrogenase
MKAVELVRREKVTFLIAAGGGSVIDGTKFIAAAAVYPEGLDPWQILTGGPAPTRALPFGSVLTLPATGSEMNCGSVVTRLETHTKLAFLNSHVFPRFSVLDPTVTFSLPEKQIANGIVDAFAHVMEQYLTYPVNAAIQDRFAESILLTLLEEGPKTLRNKEDYDSRANFMWAATMALNGLIGAGVPQDWTTHMIGHELTAKFGIDHGRTLAVILPSTLRVMAKAKQAKLLQYADRIWGIKTSSEFERIEQAIQKTEEFFESLGVSTKLKQYGVGPAEIPSILQNLRDHGMAQLGEHGTVTLAVSEEILKLSL